MLFFQQIIGGDSHVVLAGGTENMSQAPFAVRGTRFGVALGSKIEVPNSIAAPNADVVDCSSRTCSGRDSPTPTSTRRWALRPRTSAPSTRSLVRTRTSSRSAPRIVGDWVSSLRTTSDHWLGSPIKFHTGTIGCSTSQRQLRGSRTAHQRGSPLTRAESSQTIHLNSGSHQTDCAHEQPALPGVRRPASHYVPRSSPAPSCPSAILSQNRWRQMLAPRCPSTGPPLTRPVPRDHR